jgi:hypothetical protein
MPRIVLSLTTLPGRGALLSRALASLQAQTLEPDAIYLWVPQEPFAGHPIPRSVQGVPTRVVKDLGPATKLLPTLSAEQARDTLIVTVDDDVVYPPELLERLVTASSLYPDRAIGFTGFCVPEDGVTTKVLHLNETQAAGAMMQDVHILEGYRGVLYKRWFFEEQVLRGHLDRRWPSFRMHDDILLSGYLASRNIPRSVIWFADGDASAQSAWELLGDQIGLHKHDLFIKHGCAALEYWQANHKAPFPPVNLLQRTDRLQLNAAERPRAGFLHHSADVSWSDQCADIRHDLRRLPWPWRDQEFREILFTPADPVQLPPPAASLAECWRMLRPWGLCLLRTGGASDLTAKIAASLGNQTSITNIPQPATLGRSTPARGVSGNSQVSDSASPCCWQAVPQRTRGGVSILLRKAV